MEETETRLAAVRAEREALRIQLEQEREAHRATRAGLVEAEKVADEVRAFIEKCNAEQGKAFCAACGEVTERADIASHISACAAHPMRAVERERDSMRAQLAALQAEHEAAARAAEEKIGRLAEALGDAAECLSDITPTNGWGLIDNRADDGRLDVLCRARAALAEVQR